MQPMQKVVLKLDIHDDKNCKKKAMGSVTSIPGVQSVAITDTNEGLLNITGTMDPVDLVKKLRKKRYRTCIVSVGPEPDETSNKKIEVESTKPNNTVVAITNPGPSIIFASSSYNSYSNHPLYIIEEYPSTCVIM